MLLTEGSSSVWILSALRSSGSQEAYALLLEQVRVEKGVRDDLIQLMEVGACAPGLLRFVCMSPNNWPDQHLHARSSKAFCEAQRS